MPVTTSQVPPPMPQLHALTCLPESAPSLVLPRWAASSWSPGARNWPCSIAWPQLGAGAQRVPSGCPVCRALYPAGPGQAQGREEAAGSGLCPTGAAATSPASRVVLGTPGVVLARPSSGERGQAREHQPRKDKVILGVTGSTCAGPTPQSRVSPSLGQFHLPRVTGHLSEMRIIGSEKGRS